MTARTGWQSGSGATPRLQVLDEQASLDAGVADSSIHAEMLDHSCFSCTQTSKLVAMLLKGNYRNLNMHTSHHKQAVTNSMVKDADCAVGHYTQSSKI